MAAAMVSAGQGIRQMNFSLGPNRPLSFVSSTRTVLHLSRDIKGTWQQMFPRLMLQQKRYDSIARAKINSDVNITLPHPSDIILQFYIHVNEKNLEQIGTLLSDDCFFEDYTFPTPFQGKKEVLSFLQQLTTSMGQNIDFNVDSICEGTGNIAAVYWHLDWKKSRIPFTRGCSYFELSQEGERMVIKKVTALIESPIKLGGLALALLKFVNSLFDAFPEATERFLRSPHVILQLLLKIYGIFLQPIVNPLLAWYMKLWRIAVGVLGLAYKLLQHIAKILNM